MVLVDTFHSQLKILQIKCHLILDPHQLIITLHKLSWDLLGMQCLHQDIYILSQFLHL